MTLNYSECKKNEEYFLMFITTDTLSAIYFLIIQCDVDGDASTSTTTTNAAHTILMTKQHLTICLKFLLYSTQRIIF